MLLHALMVVGGLFVIGWGFWAAHNAKSPSTSLAQFSILIGLAVAILGTLLVCVPRLFLRKAKRKRWKRVRIFKALRGVVIIFAILVAMVWVKTYSYGQNQYKEGEKAMAAAISKTPSPITKPLSTCTPPSRDTSRPLPRGYGR